SAVVTVSVIVPPDPGLDNNVDACNSDEAFNLFTALGGTPEIGGSWTELTTSGAVIAGNEVDFTGVAAGTYQFQYAVPATSPCADPTAIVTVDVIEAVSAGIDNLMPVCGSETAFNMFGALKGTPTAGGTWADLDGSGGTITGDAIDLSAVAPGLY